MPASFRTAKRGRNAHSPYRLHIEKLKDRLLLATFNVDSTIDDTDINPGDGICSNAPVGGVCTLRAAIVEANALPNLPSSTPDTTVPAGTYTLTFG
jgi:CSLREA domain-containing protein